MSDINRTNTFNEKSIKGGTGQPHYARRGHDVFYEKKAMRKLHVDVDAACESREKEDIQDITGVVVGVCGPVELARDVIDAVGSVDGDRRNRVGGIEVHEEYVIFLVISSNSSFFLSFPGFLVDGCIGILYFFKKNYMGRDGRPTCTYFSQK